jgi:hemerythrin-like domain-containing protein
VARLTEKLSEEHKDILKVIGAVGRECEALGAGAEIDADFFAKAIDFIRNYADKYHHAKEEDILFEELGRPDVQMHCDPTQQMLREHEMGRDFVRGLEAGVEAGSQIETLKNALGYGELLQQHIYKEDNILYPMAEQALSEERSREIAARFAEVDAKFAAENEKYLAIVAEFAERKVAVRQRL